MTPFPDIPGYRFESKLGEGGMAVVYRGVQEKLKRTVAIKILDPRLLKDPSFAKRFVLEAETAASLSHPNIVTIHDVGHENGYYFMVMEYLPGGSLKERIHSAPLQEVEVMDILLQMASALAHAHARGLLHRDIKPDNIMFRSDGTAVLVDFGIARAADSSSRLTESGVSIGTPLYMSPEQARGLELDSRSDLYSLGIVFFEMLTGQVPYQASDSIAIAVKHIQEPVPTLNGDLEKFQPLLNRLMCKEPGGRFFSAEELVNVLNLKGKGDDATIQCLGLKGQTEEIAAQVVNDIVEEKSRRKLILVLSLLLVLMVIAVVMVWLLRNGSGIETVSEKESTSKDYTLVDLHERPDKSVGNPSTDYDGKRSCEIEESTILDLIGKAEADQGMIVAVEGTLVQRLDDSPPGRQHFFLRGNEGGVVLLDAPGNLELTLQERVKILARVRRNTITGELFLILEKRVAR